MEQLMKLDKEYAQWIAELAQRYRSSQIKAAIKVNDEMLRFYWSVGEDIEKRQYENRYGSHFYENVSKDLRKALDLTRGMSESTIRYTHYFYCLYSQLIGNRQQDAEDFKSPILQQDAEVFQVIFNIPWTHHMCIIDKVKGDAKKGLFFARKSLENNWGRAVLLNFLSSDLYERQGAAQTNFALTIPAPESDLAQELLKSPYDFTFLPGKERYQEAELKDALIEHITRLCRQGVSPCCRRKGEVHRLALLHYPAASILRDRGQGYGVRFPGPRPTGRICCHGGRPSEHGSREAGYRPADLQGEEYRPCTICLVNNQSPHGNLRIRGCPPAAA